MTAGYQERTSSKSGGIGAEVDELEEPVRGVPDLGAAVPVEPERVRSRRLGRMPTTRSA